VVVKNLKQIILYIIMIFLLMSFAYAEYNLGSSLTGTVTQQACDGMVIQPITNVSLDYLYYNAAPMGAELVQIYTGLAGTPTSLYNITANNSQNFTLPAGIILNAGQNYTIATSGASFVYWYNLATTPVNSKNIKFMAGANGYLTGNKCSYFDPYNRLHARMYLGIGATNYTSGGGSSYFLSFISQSPSDLNTSNIFSQQLNITYNYNLSMNLSSAYLNISILNSLDNCTIYFNNTCIVANNTPRLFYNITGEANKSYLFDDNKYIPATYRMNETIFDEQTLSFYNLTGLNQMLVFREYSINNLTAYGFEEIGLNTTGVCNVYFMNRTTSSLAILLGNTGATLLTSFNSSSFNHCHEGGGTTHCDNIIGMPIINYKVNNVTSFNREGYIAIKPSSAGVTCKIAYSNNASLSSNSGDIFTSNTAGVTYSNETFQVRSHLHQFGTSLSTRIVYDSCGNFSGINNCTGTPRTDYFDLSPLPPSSVTIYEPLLDQNIIEYLRVNCSNAFSPAGSTIINYTFYLLNSDESTNRTLGINATGCQMYNNTYNMNLSIGQYKIRIEVRNNLSLSSNTTSDLFNITKNMRLNITAYDSLTNLSIQNFSINFFNLAIGTNETFTTNDSYMEADLIRSTSYNYSFNGGLLYAIFNSTITTNSTPYQFLNLTIPKTNSVTIYMRDSGSSAILSNITINVTLTSNSTQYLYNTTTGTLFVYNITADIYEFKFNANNYAENTYFLTITNGSTQTLNAYLTQTGTDVIFTFKDDSSGAVLEGVAVQVSRIINTSWVVIDTKFTDITGRTKFNLLFTTNYRFSNSFAGYDDKIFNLNPVLFTSYDVFMSKVTGINSNEMDYSDISVQFLPLMLYSNNTNNFTWEIRSPTGKLISYLYNLTYPCGNQTFSGVSTTGDFSLKTFNITCANATSTATLFYQYTTTSGETKTYLTSIGIISQINNYTYTSNATDNFGLGMFERVLIVMIVIIVVAGISSMIGGLAFGTLLGLLIMAFFIYQGFFPFWAGILPIIIGFFIIKESTGR
jgi:hypothetical protein